VKRAASPRRPEASTGGATGGEIRTIRSPRLKTARQLARRSFRQRSRLFLAEGPQAVREALGWPAASRAVVGGGTAPSPVGGGTAPSPVGGGTAPSPVGGGTAPSPGGVTELFVTAPAWSRYSGLLAEAAALGAAVHTVSGEVMAELAQTVTPQGLLAVCSFVDVPLDQLLATRPRLVVLLANVRDPGNAGTVLRTADAAGADGVIFSDASVDPYNSKCVRAAAGSLFHLPVVVGCPVHQAAAALRSAGISVLAADGGADRELGQVEADGALAHPTAWLFGNEAWGLPAELLALADQPVAVPIYGRAESLNLAAAAAVCLYASARVQRSS